MIHPSTIKIIQVLFNNGCFPEQINGILKDLKQDRQILLTIEMINQLKSDKGAHNRFALKFLKVNLKDVDKGWMNEIALEYRIVDKLNFDVAVGKRNAHLS